MVTYSVLGKKVSKEEYDRLTSADKAYDKAVSEGDEVAAKEASKEFTKARRSAGIKSTAARTRVIGVGTDAEGNVVTENVGAYLDDKGRQQVSELTEREGRLAVTKLAEERYKDAQGQEYIRREVELASQRKAAEEAENRSTGDKVDEFAEGEKSVAPVNYIERGNNTFSDARNKSQDTPQQFGKVDLKYSIRPDLEIDAKEVLRKVEETPLEERRVDLSVDATTLEGLSKADKLNKFNIDSYEKSFQETNFKTFEIRSADTTTEKFRLVPEANPFVYEIYESGRKVEANIEKFYDKEALKGVGIVVGTAAAAAVAPVALAAAGVSAGVGASSATSVVVSRSLQVAYGASVVARGAKIASAYDSSAPTATILQARNLVGEVVGVGAGSAIARNRAAAALAKKYKGALVSDFQKQRAIEQSLGNVKIEYAPDVVIRGSEVKGFVYATKVESFGGVTRAQTYVNPVTSKLKVIDPSKAVPDEFLATRYSEVASRVSPVGKEGLVSVNAGFKSSVSQGVVSSSSVPTKEVLITSLDFTGRAPTGFQGLEFGSVAYGAAPKVASSVDDPFLIAYQQKSFVFKPKSLTYQGAEPFKFQVTTQFGVTNVRYDFETGITTQVTKAAKPIVITDIVPEEKVVPSAASSAVVESSRAVKTFATDVKPSPRPSGDVGSVGGFAQETIVVLEPPVAEAVFSDLAASSGVGVQSDSAKKTFGQESFSTGVYKIESVVKVSPVGEAVKKTSPISDVVGRSRSRLSPAVLVGVGESSLVSESRLVPALDVKPVGDTAVASDLALVRDVALDTSQTNRSDSRSAQASASALAQARAQASASANNIKLKAPVPVKFFKKDFDNKSQKGGAFDVFVRKRGVFSKVNPFALSEGDALDFGAFKLYSSPRASFFLKPTSKPAVRGSKDYAGFFRKTRSNLLQKGNIFIERREKRIKSSGEKAGITRKGLLAIKAKNKFGKVF